MIPRSGLFLCCAAAAIGAQGTTAVQQPPEFLRGKGGTAPRGTGPTHGELLSAGTTGYDWLTHTRDYAGSRYSPLARIRADNVARLRPVCRYEVGSEDMFQTGPIVYRGTMFITTVYSTYALDAATCRLKWRHDWQRLATQIRIVNRGVAVKDGRVVRGTTDGYLVALDARTGGMLWARRVADAERGETFSMPPLIYDSLVFIGPAVSASALKGWVGAFRLSDGRPVWRFNIVRGRASPAPRRGTGARTSTPVAARCGRPSRSTRRATCCTWRRRRRCRCSRRGFAAASISMRIPWWSCTRAPGSWRGTIRWSRPTNTTGI
jgi:glucose dehydrogenase